MTFPLPPGSVEGDNFGFSIAADGDTAVVTSYSYPNRDSIETNGAAYVYTFDGSAWSFQQELIPVDPDPYENYGWDADVSGDTIVVSAASNSWGSETVPGKVFVFTRTNNTWTQTQILVEPRQVTNAQVYNDRYDGFAESVAIDGDRIAVGHPYYNYFITITDPNGSSMEYESTSSGAVFVYDRSDNFTTSTILSGGLPEDDFFNIGYSVDVAGDTIIASANAYSVEAGMAYIFKDTGNSYTTQKLLPAVSGNNGRITGTVAIGTYKDSSGQSSRIVAVITYDGLDNDILLELYVQNGDTWILTTQFDGPAPESGFVDQEWVFQHMVFGDNVLFAGGIEYGAGSAIFPILINPDGTGTHTAPFRTYVGALAATDTQLLYGTTGNFNILFEHEQEPPGTGARSRFYDYPAPSVTSITPVSGTLNVPPDTLLGATFSEPVTTTDDYGQLYCANSREFFRFTPPLTNVTEFTIGPPDFFQPGEYCQFTLFGDAFTDGVNGLDADDNGTGGDNAGGYFNVAVAAPDGGDVSAGTFVNSGQFLGIRQSADVELGDIDNDGDLDAVVINYENPTRMDSGLDEIWLNDGSGAFTLFSTLTFNDDPMFSDGVEDISLVDINNDGNLDIATGTGVVRPGNGDGTFGDVIEILVNGDRQYNDPSNVFADINGDGLLDYVGGSVPLGNGDFTFSRAPEPGGYWGQYASMQTTTDIELGDFNNDGNIDILGAYSDRIVVYLTDGTPYLFTDDTFGTAAPVTTYTEIAVADLNGDANLDVVLSGGTLSFGNGDGTFSDSVELPDRSSVFRYIPGDLDGDGDMDLVGASSTGNNPVYKNDGSGGFTRDPDIVTGDWTSDVAIGDLDGDGDLDAFFAANDSTDPRDPKNASTVWLNRQTPVDIRKPGIVYTDTESSSKHSCSEIGMRDALSLADYSTEPATITFEPGCTTIDVTQPLLMQFDSLSIDGGGTVTFDGGGTSRLFFVYGARPLTLRGVTLQNAYSDEDGAAITVLSGDFVIEDSVLRDNVSVSGGGAIRNSGVDWWTKGELTIHNTQFINNASSGDGGAIR
ncbi:MAG: FG-GAP-like repeat-containing protein, partial [Chloroflexota bacterium]